MAKRKRKRRRAGRGPAPVRVAIVLEGGLVRGVITNTRHVEAAVLDTDVEGAGDDEVVTLECGGETLEGVPCLKEVLVNSKFTDALFNLTNRKE
jgi:hypothetical protein